MHTILEHLHAIDEHVLHTLGVLVWLGIGRRVSNGRRVEDDDVGAGEVPRCAATWPTV